VASGANRDGKLEGEYSLMTGAKQIQKEIEAVKRVLNVGPEPTWKQRAEETEALMIRYAKQLEDSANSMTCEEVERELSSLPEAQTVEEACRRAHLRNILSKMREEYFDHSETDST